MEEFKAVVFEYVGVKLWEMSKLIALLLVLAYQGSDIKIATNVFENK